MNIITSAIVEFHIIHIPVCERLRVDVVMTLASWIPLASSPTYTLVDAEFQTALVQLKYCKIR